MLSIRTTFPPHITQHSAVLISPEILYKGFSKGPFHSTEHPSGVSGRLLGASRGRRLGVVSTGFSVLRRYQDGGGCQTLSEVRDGDKGTENPVAHATGREPACPEAKRGSYLSGACCGGTYTGT